MILLLPIFTTAYNRLRRNQGWFFSPPHFYNRLQQNQGWFFSSPHLYNHLQQYTTQSRMILFFSPFLQPPTTDCNGIKDDSFLLPIFTTTYNRLQRNQEWIFSSPHLYNHLHQYTTQSRMILFFSPFLQPTTTECNGIKNESFSPPHLYNQRMILFSSPFIQPTTTVYNAIKNDSFSSPIYTTECNSIQRNQGWFFFFSHLYNHLQQYTTQ